MQPEDAVNLTITLVLESPEEDNDGVANRLVASGIDSDLAQRLLALVPLAFSRAYYESVPMEKEYAEDYIVVEQRTERETSYSIASDPYFRAAANAAIGAANEGQEDLIRLVAQRSPEYDAINNVLSNLPAGAVPKRIGTSPPVIVCSERPPRLWWKFW